MRRRWIVVRHTMIRDVAHALCRGYLTSCLQGAAARLVGRGGDVVECATILAGPALEGRIALAGGGADLAAGRWHRCLCCLRAVKSESTTKRTDLTLDIPTQIYDVIMMSVSQSTLFASATTNCPRPPQPPRATPPRNLPQLNRVNHELEIGPQNDPRRRRGPCRRAGGRHDDARPIQTQVR